MQHGQFMPMEEVPEKSWAYRLAKRFFFNDFGAYDRPVNPLSSPAEPAAKG